MSNRSLSETRAKGEILYIRYKRSDAITIYTHKTHELLQVFKQVVASLFSSCGQVGFALLLAVNIFNKLEGIIRLVTRLF